MTPLAASAPAHLGQAGFGAYGYDIAHLGLAPADDPTCNESVDRFSVGEELAGQWDDYRS